MSQRSISLHASFLLLLILTSIFFTGFHVFAYENSIFPSEKGVTEEIWYTETSRSFLITVTSFPVGIPITIDGSNYITPASFSWEEGSTHRITAEPVIVTGNDERLTFAKWNDGLRFISRAIVVTSEVTIAAEWKKQFFLTVDENIGKASGQGWYDEGSVAVVEAALPNRDDGTFVEDAVHERYRFLFVNWTGDVTSDSRKITLIIDEPKTVKANWKTQYFLSINAGYGREWRLGPGEYWKGVDQELQQWVDSGQSITVNALSPSRVVPEASRHVFTHWEGSATGSSPNLTITMDSWKQLTANWNREFFLQVNSEFGEPKADGWYKAGAIATPSVTSPIGFGVQQVFLGWTGDLVSSEPTASITMNAPKNVTAVWRTDITQLLAIISAIIVIGTIAVTTKLGKRRDRRALQSTLIIIAVVIAGLIGFNLNMLTTSQIPQATAIPQETLIFVSPNDGEDAELLGKIEFKVKDAQKLSELGVDHVHIGLNGETATTFLYDEGYRPATIFFNQETGEGFFYYAGTPSNEFQTVSIVLATENLREFPESQVAITIRGDITLLLGANGANG